MPVDLCFHKQLPFPHKIAPLIDRIIGAFSHRPLNLSAFLTPSTEVEDRDSRDFKLAPLDCRINLTYESSRMNASQMAVRRRVLLVDDEPSIRTIIMTLLLDRLGYTVRAVIEPLS